ncbi:MAG: FtsX-like permease family protein [Candidatus Aminicenantes bacterium]|nr:FtsX-like permease family protein [Candidatus Aminicenantes bacterium]
MFRNYIKIAVRNIFKHKGYSLINLIGLAVGIACCVLILLFVQDEISFDRYHEKADRIFRVIEEVRLEGVGEESSSMPFPTGDTLPLEYPKAIEASVRFYNFQLPSMSVEYGTSGEKRFNEPRFFFADPAVFQVFDFALIEGDPKVALMEPNTVVVTEAMANKYFEDENPIGKTLRWQGAANLQVTGVLKNILPNSHFQFDFLGSFATLRRLYGGILPQDWYWNPCWTYILLKEGVSSSDLEARFPDLVQKYFPDSIKDKVKIKLQPLTDIHLYSHLDYEINPNSNISYIYIFSAIAVFVLLIACINFMNLATARSANRGREVGMRKVLGAYRIQLIKQFLGESLLLCFISALLSILIVEIVLPAFNAFSGKELSADYLGDWRLLAGLAIITITVGVFSGLYPAFFLSGFDPVKVIKGIPEKSGRSSLFRRVLVVVQFTISIVLIIGTIICFQQLNYLRNTRLGFDQDQVIMLPAYGTGMSRWYERFRERILQDPHVMQLTAVEDVLGAKYQTGSFIPEGALESNMQQFPLLVVAFDFIETFDMEMASGRSFSREFPSDITQGIIINESAAQRFGWSPELAPGKRLRQQTGQMLTVVGVVKDFNYTSLALPITPFVLEMPRNPGQMSNRIRYVCVKISGTQIPQTLDFLKSTWEELVPNRSFGFFFLDDELDKLYDAEEKMGRVFGVFTVLAILIACLGLFALASFTTELRTHEIGIRKVMGAQVSGIIFLLSREFAKWVLIANLVAWPTAYLIMQNWLDGFAYRIDIGILTFLQAMLLAFGIALFTVSFQAVKAALADPVKSIRHQ